LFFEDSKVHRDSNSKNGNSLRSVRVHSRTLSYTPESMRCDSQPSLLARTFASPKLRLWHTFTRRPSKYLSNTFTQPYVNVLGVVNENVYTIIDHTFLQIQINNWLCVHPKTQNFFLIMDHIDFSQKIMIFWYF
jgi:hypothetical protein